MSPTGCVSLNRPPTGCVWITLPSTPRTLKWSKTLPRPRRVAGSSVRSMSRMEATVDGYMGGYKDGGYKGGGYKGCGYMGDGCIGDGYICDGYKGDGCG